MSQKLSKTEASRILRFVPFENGFHFYMANGVYTKVTATSLEDFSQKIDDVDAASIMFHYPRGDIQKWIEDTLGDKELANRMCFIKTGISGEELRKQLINLVQKRINGLKEI